jgi:hypothetical protein
MGTGCRTEFNMFSMIAFTAVYKSYLIGVSGVSRRFWMDPVIDYTSDYLYTCCARVLQLQVPQSLWRVSEHCDWSIKPWLLLTALFTANSQGRWINQRSCCLFGPVTSSQASCRLQCSQHNLLPPCSCFDTALANWNKQRCSLHPLIHKPMQIGCPGSSQIIPWLRRRMSCLSPMGTAHWPRGSRINATARSNERWYYIEMGSDC